MAQSEHGRGRAIALAAKHDGDRALDAVIDRILEHLSRDLPRARHAPRPRPAPTADELARARGECCAQSRAWCVCGGQQCPIHGQQHGPFSHE